MNNTIATKKYRHEIDGLRAISILGVVIFHLNPKFLPGGFLGVDVFFVISGFLIGGIITDKLNSSSFSLFEFWLRRYRRLYPNLLLMVTLTVLCGNFILINPERSDLFWQAIGSIFSFSNVLLWKTTGGYWHTASDNIALLHTWSLSVEEQFYFILPLLLIIVHSFFSKRSSWIFFLLIILSFALCVFLTPIRRSAAFYLLPTRMWELFIGVSISQLKLATIMPISKRYTLFILIIGLILIVCSFVYIKNDQFFPGFLPIFSCLGAALVLSYGDSINVITRFLSAPPISYIGKASYSIYLWHWPIIVFTSFCKPFPSSFLVGIISIGISLPAYHFVELPLRMSTRKASIFCIFTFLLLSVGLFSIYTHADSFCLPSSLASLEDPLANSRGWEFEATSSILSSSNGVIVGDKDSLLKIALLGSSHARVLGAPFKEFAEQNHCRGIILATTMVGLATNNSNSTPQAEKINETRFNLISEIKPEVLLIAGRWGNEFHEDKLENNLPDLLRQFSVSAKYVILVSQVPTFNLPTSYTHSLQKFLLAASRSGVNNAIEPLSDVASTNEKIKALIKNLGLQNIYYFDAEKLFLNQDGSIRFMDNQKFLYSDYNHINDNGARFIFNSGLESIIKDIIRTDAPTLVP